MDERQFGLSIAALRRELSMTQEELADRLHVSAQAVSKWENGRSLPETALLPALSQLLGVRIDQLFETSALRVLEAKFGDGLEAIDVTARLNRLIDEGRLEAPAAAQLLGVAACERPRYLAVRYQTRLGECRAWAAEGEWIKLSADDAPVAPVSGGLNIVAGRYGSAKHHYDAMPRIEHYRFFGWREYRANHELFPSDPANDGAEYLTLVYENAAGLFIATCAEGERLAFSDAGDRLERRGAEDECLLPGMPSIPPFGGGMECSWAAALTAALRAMGANADYDAVMGASGACYRLAFCSPTWDYSSVDALVAFDYATPGYAAFGYRPALFGRIEKADRPAHRARIMKEIRAGMPVLGINLRVAAEWGTICGYRKGGEELLCRTKFDDDVLRSAEYRAHPMAHDYLFVDNWPFLLCYFEGKTQPPTERENLIGSLKVFLEYAERPSSGGYFTGLNAYRVWAADLRDEAFYIRCDDGQLARRLSVNQFCTLALEDARHSAHSYLSAACGAADVALSEIAALFEQSARSAQDMRRALETPKALEGSEARAFWTPTAREAQAQTLDAMAELERRALEKARAYLGAATPRPS